MDADETRDNKPTTIGYIGSPSLPAGSSWSGWAYSGEAKASYISVRARARIAPGIGTVFYVQLDVQVIRNGVGGYDSKPYGVIGSVSGTPSEVFSGSTASSGWVTAKTLYFQGAAAAGTTIPFTAGWYTQIIAPGGSLTVPQGIILNIPVYVNVGGAVHQVDKAYINIGGIVKECDIYLNVNGAIKLIK